MIKRIVSIVVILILSLCLCLTIIACDPTQDNDPAQDNETVVDTYTGVVSEQIYTTKEATAEAFLNNEISGNSTQAVFLSMYEEGQLTESEINSLSLDASAREGLISGEKITIQYRLNRATAHTAKLTKDDMAMSARAYFLSYKNTVYRYFAPPLLTGEPITKSYYDSVFNTDQYINCTLTYDDVGLVLGDIQREIEIKTASDCFSFCGYAYSAILKAYEKYERYGFDSGISILQFVTVTRLKEGYFLDSTLTEKPWELVGFDKGSFFKSEILNYLNCLNARLDYTCFEKTETGFAAIIDNAGDFDENDWMIYFFDIDNFEFHNAICNIYVEDGHIVKSEHKIEYSLDGTKCEGSSVWTVNGFGTTSVVIPAEVQQVPQMYWENITKPHY